MDRVDWYFRQLVTEGEMDFAFDQVQDRIEQVTSQAETKFDGIISGGDVAEAGVPDLTVDVGGDGFGYTPEGKRLAWPAGETNVDVSEDDFAVSTEVTTPGNSRWISIFVEFDEAFDDLRTDGFGSPVFWKRLSSHRFFVVMSDEDVSPTRPPLRSDALLLADIIRVYAQTTIQNTDINVSRREDYFRNEGNFRSNIIRGTAKETLHDILDEFNLFASDLDSNSPYPAGASLVGVAAYSAAPPNGTDLGFLVNTTVEDGLRELIDQLVESSPESGADRIGFTPVSWLSADSVAGAINEIISDLGTTAAAESGATRIGIEANASTPAGGLPFGITADEKLWTALEQHFSSVAAVGAGNSGNQRIGARAETGAIVVMPSPATLAAGSIRAQLKELVDYIETIRNTPFAASAVSYTPHDYVTSTNVQAAINELIDDLQSMTAAAGNGAREIGYEGNPTAVETNDAPSFGASPRPLYQILDIIFTGLANRASLNGGQLPFLNVVAFGDVNHTLALVSSNPRQVMDSGSDYFEYNRAGNRFGWFIGGTEYLRAGNTGAAIWPAGTAGLDVGVDHAFWPGPVANTIRLGGVSGVDPIRFTHFSGILTIETGGGGSQTGVVMNPPSSLIAWRYANANQMWLDGGVDTLRPESNFGLDLGTLVKKWDTIYANRFNPRLILAVPGSQEDVATRHANNAIVAWCSVTSGGGLSSGHWNIASVTGPAVGVYTITLDQAVSQDSAIQITGQDNATDDLFTAVFTSTTVIQVQCRDASSGSAASGPFSFTIIGRPSTITW